MTELTIERLLEMERNLSKHGEDDDVLTLVRAELNRRQQSVEADETRWDDDGYCECEDGWIENPCFEDTCCCADPLRSHGFRPCPLCNAGGSR